MVRSPGGVGSAAHFYQMEEYMRGYLFAIAAAGALMLAPQLAPRVSAGEGPTTPAPAQEMIKWDLAHLNQDPLKLVSATPDPQRGIVRFVLEFTRAPMPTELYDWEKVGGPAVFRFLDADGVALRTVKPQLDGELVPKQGARMRLLLRMPDERILAATRTVVAD